MAQRMVVFDAKDVLALLTHYNEGRDLPLDVELLGVGISPFLQRWVGFECESNKWEDGTLLEGGGMSPLHIRYEGKKVLAMSKKGEEGVWLDANDAPNRQ